MSSRLLQLVPPGAPIEPGYLVTLENASAHPARIDVFSDAGSWWHIIGGFMVGLLPAQYELALSTVFLGYELSEAATGEDWQRTGGKLIEFSLGLLLARLVGAQILKAVR